MLFIVITNILSISEDVYNFTDFRYNVPGNLVVIKVRVPGCKACEALQPKFIELAAEYPKFVFLEVNYMNCWPVLLDYNLTVVPTVIFSFNGIEESRVLTIKKEVVEDALKLAVSSCNLTSTA